jgi:hypothetical protein
MTGRHVATPDPDCGPCTAVRALADVNARDHAAGRHELLARAGCPGASCRARIVAAMALAPGARCADSYGPARDCLTPPSRVLVYTGRPGAGTTDPDAQPFCEEHARRTLARFAHCYQDVTPA